MTSLDFGVWGDSLPQDSVGSDDTENWNYRIYITGKISRCKIRI